MEEIISEEIISEIKLIFSSGLFIFVSFLFLLSFTQEDNNDIRPRIYKKKHRRLLKR